MDAGFIYVWRRVSECLQRHTVMGFSPVSGVEDQQQRRSLVSGTWFLYRTESSGIDVLSEDALARWSFDYICKAADLLRLIAATQSELGYLHERWLISRTNNIYEASLNHDNDPSASDWT